MSDRSREDVYGATAAPLAGAGCLGEPPVPPNAENGSYGLVGVN